MKYILFILLITLICTANTIPYLYERNFYKEELVFKRDNFSFGAKGGTLYTKWHTLIADNVSFVIYDNNKLRYIQDGNLIELKDIDTKKFNQTENNKILDYIDSEFTQRFGTQTTKRFINCIDEIYKDIDIPLVNELWQQHFRFPYVHIIPHQGGYCFEKP